ncbi:MAG: hypothetical protein U1E25_04065 [Methylocystis sp.]
MISPALSHASNKHLREHPEDGRGFEVIAPYLLRTGRGEEAIHAYAEAAFSPGRSIYRPRRIARVVAAQGLRA